MRHVAGKHATRHIKRIARLGTKTRRRQGLRPVTKGAEEGYEQRKASAEEEDE